MKSMTLRQNEHKHYIQNFKVNEGINGIWLLDHMRSREEKPRRMEMKAKTFITSLTKKTPWKCRCVDFTDRFQLVQLFLKLAPVSIEDYAK